MAPVQTYYGGSAEEEQDLLELRKAHYERLHALELQAARFGEAVPASIAAGIADAESQIRAIDEVRAASIRPETAERIGQTGEPRARLRSEIQHVRKLADPVQHSPRGRRRIRRSAGA